MRQEIKWSDDQKVQNLSIEELANTADYKGIQKHETSHHELFGEVVKDLKDRGYKADISEIFVSKSGIDKPTIRQVEKDKFLTSVNDVRGLIVRNCIGRINITGDGFEGGGSNQQIGISYNKQGIVMAMGQNISVCANLNIFGGQMMQNYGTSSMPLMRMMEIMASWIQNMRSYRERDLAVLDALRLREIDPVREVDEVIGNMHRLTEMQQKNTKIVAPLNHSRINDLQRGVLAFEGPLKTAYDLYQCATEVSTHQNTLENRLGNTSDIGSYFQNRYNSEIKAITTDITSIPVV